MAKNKITVNPMFRLDVDGKLFLNKDSNLDVQNTIIFNSLMTRLNIEKGYLPTFPNLGLKQHLYKFNFIDKEDIESVISNFEDDVMIQMNQGCTIEYEMDTDNRSIKLEFNLEKMKYNVMYEYTNVNGAIKIINYSFVD